MSHQGLASKGDAVSSVGEKWIIEHIIRPLFNPYDNIAGVGDDCTFIEVSGDERVIASTDRVPADLIAFRLGLIGYHDLGVYLARLNISDIVACGGFPAGLLFNVAVPDAFLLSDLTSLCTGVLQGAQEYGCDVLGGDISSSQELSLSATSLGRVPKKEFLSRRNAAAGDTVFCSRPLGLTPAAFAFYLDLHASSELSKQEGDLLKNQFTKIGPLLGLGRELARSGECSACIDNTDGVGESLREISAASKISIVLRKERISIPDVVAKVARVREKDVYDLAFGAGADFSLVGTLRGSWSQDRARQIFGHQIQLLGFVEEGEGVFVEEDTHREALNASRWDYFQAAR